MELHQLKYFLAVAEEGSFTRAAAKSGISQPSLTNAIGMLERSLGARLFHRNHSGATLTELGRALKPHFAEMVATEKLIRQIVAAFV
jgi:LysR family hydrogen peroxide-inducible transcriptional activator